MPKLNFADYIYSYFTRYLPLQRGLSQNTISSYSYSLTLFLQYCNDEISIPCTKLTLDRIDKHLVENYLLWLEAKRSNCVTTRNQRLSAIKSIFQYIQSESVAHTALYRDIMSIPEKKSPTIPPKYLTEEEIEVLFAMPDVKTRQGRRDLVLLLLLYDSAARAGEIIELKFGDISFGKAPTVKLFGKGRKTRIVPITPKTADMLKCYANEFCIFQPEQYVFVNRSNGKLTTTGISYILNKYVNSGKELNPHLFRMSTSPHLLRSTKASHLIQKGVNIYYIRDFLGHSSVTSTERYARNNPEVVRAAVKKASVDLLGDKKYFSENEKSALLDFLKGFQ